MDEAAPRAGWVVSGAMHLALLAVLALGFSRAAKFDDAPESIPVETITSTQLNEIMEGERQAKPSPAPAKPAPPLKPAPPQPATPPAPEPPARPPPPKPEPAKPEPPAPEPPSRPPPPKPEPAKPEAPAPEPPKRPEPAKPEPPKPEPPKPLAEAPRPPARPAKTEDAPRPPSRPIEAAKPQEKFKPDEIAKALAAKDKAEDKAEDKPKTRSAFDAAAISKMIGQTKTAEVAPSAPQGLPNHRAAHMSVSLENALNEWFRDSYKNCWSLPPSNPAGDNYVFDVRVIFNPDGSLSGRPVMLNPPRDPEWQAHADSVMRAVMRCNPLRIPTQYAPFFDQWRSKTIHFDPASAEG